MDHICRRLIFLCFFTVISIFIRPDIVFPNDRNYLKSTIDNVVPRNDLFLSFKSLSFDDQVTSVSLNDDMRRQSGFTVDDSASALFLSFNSKKLLGKLGFAIDPKFMINLESPKITIQYYELKSQTFKLLAHDKLDENGRVTLDIPGIYTTNLRLIFDGFIKNQHFVELIEVKEIVHSQSVRVMPIGDSITKGTGSTDGVGYRKSLYHLLRDYGFDVDFVGGFGGSPYEGHFTGGAKIFDFYPRALGGSGNIDVTNYMNRYRPNLVTLFLGTNNVTNYTPAGPYTDGNGFNSTSGGQMATLVKYLLSWKNGQNGTNLQSIVVSLISPIAYNDSACVEFNAEMTRVVEDFQNGRITGQAEPVYLCDHFSRFTERPNLWTYGGLMADHTHPSNLGHSLIARTFYERLRSLWEGPRWFSDVSWKYRIAAEDHYQGSQGLAIADVTQDGYDELYVSRIVDKGQNKREFYYVNQQNAPFQEMARASGIEDNGGSRGGVFVDIDNDGDFDLFNANAPGMNRLYENLGNNSFRDITNTAGIENTGNVTTTSVIALDIENDGDMDLYSVNSRVQNELYLNNGIGKFARVNRGANDTQEPQIPSLSGSAVDYDNDGDADIYVVKRSAENKLFINNGNGYFTEGAEQAGIAIKTQSNGVVWADFDNDADLDLLITPTKQGGENNIIRIWENNGNGTFTNHSTALSIPSDGYTTLVSDFDNDGYVDIITTNEESLGSLYKNIGNWSFDHIRDTGAEVFNGDVRGGGVLDFDLDGDQDFFLCRSDAFNSLYQNNIDNNNFYLRINVYGPNNNLGGFGTKIWVYRSGELGNSDALLGYREVLSSSGHQTQYSPCQHFGLGDNNLCDILARFTDGTLVVRRDVGANQTITIRSEFSAGVSGEPAEMRISSGNQQQQTVGQQLAEPLVIKVVDNKQNPVKGVEVQYSLEKGDAHVIEPVSNEENKWLEAEHGEIFDNVFWAYDETASGDGIIITPDFMGDGGHIVLNLQITSAAQHYMWIRATSILEPKTLQVQVDEDDTKNLLIDSRQQWKWFLVKNQSNTPQVFYLANGEHSVQVTLPENILIDRVLFTPDVNYQPVGAGESSVSPDATDENGLAGRFLQLGQTAGEVIVKVTTADNGTLKGEPVLFTVDAMSGPPVQFIKTGDMQTNVQVGVPLEKPFVVELQDAFGNPTPAIPVYFELISGGGSIDPAGMVLTNLAGQASTRLTPGDETSLQQVQARIDGLNGSPITFSAIVPGIAHEIQYISGKNQTGIVGQFLEKPLTVRVLTESAEPAEGYPVIFRVNHDGKLAHTVDSTTDSSIQVATDTQGYAKAYWQLGSLKGVQTVYVETPGLVGSPVEINATAISDDPFRILAMDGNGQHATVMDELPNPLKVRVVDKFNNPIYAHPVELVSQTTGGIFPTTGAATITGQTDSSGYFSARYRVGEIAGENYYHIQANAEYNNRPLEGSPQSFHVTALPEKAAAAEKLSHDEQEARVGEFLDNPFQLKVTDSYGNAVQDFDVIFQVMEGGGTLENNSSITKQTNEHGIASVLLKVGHIAGDKNQIVKAVLNGIVPSTILFRASALPDSPDKLVYQSGNDQISSINSTLPQPFVVKVVDQFDNSVSGHPVTFQILSEQGSFNGSKIQTRTSDYNGDASVFLTLGSVVGDSNHVVTASSQYNNQELEQSPVTFYASSSYANPTRLLPISDTDGLLGSENRELKDPITVKIVDHENKPVPNMQVDFFIESGGGHFASNGEQYDHSVTDVDGFASMRWVLGSANQVQRIKAECKYRNVHLENSPSFFQAHAIKTNASKMILISGDSQTVRVGHSPADELRVKIVDEFNNGVENHPVRFTVTTELVSFAENNESQIITYSGPDGMASVSVKVGTAVGQGVARVICSSDNTNGGALENSPIEFNMQILPAEPSMELSTLSVTSPIPATGLAKSEILLTLFDLYGNPVTDRRVRFDCSSEDVVFENPEGITDENGHYLTQAACSIPGIYTIRAQDVKSGAWLHQTGKINFIESRADQVLLFGGNHQTGYPNSILAEPLAVRIVDNNNKPVPGYPVKFSVNPDSAHIVGADSVLSDAEGIAAIDLVIHNITGPIRVLAHASGLTQTPIYFSATSIAPDNLTIQRQSVTRYEGQVNDIYNDTLKVKVMDIEGRPVGDVDVFFSSNNIDIAWVDTLHTRTDFEGVARTGLQFGEKVGITRIEAKLVTGPFTFFDVYTLPGNANDLVIVGGNQQQLTVGTILPESLKVRIQDEWGNGIENAMVAFSVLKGKGSVLGSAIGETDTFGIVKKRFRLGPLSGEQIVRVSSNAIPEKYVDFTFIALPDTAVALELIDGNDQAGIAGHMLNLPIDVKVVDQYSNGVPNVDVLFLPGNNHGRVLPDTSISSDSDGKIRVRWILGPVTGPQKLYVLHSGLENSPLRIDADAILNSKPVIKVEDFYQVYEQNRLEFDIKITDPENDLVHLTLKNPPSGAKLDSVHFSWTPGFQQAGHYELMFVAKDTAGAQTEKRVKINVLNKNRPPRIIMDQSYPENHDLVTVKDIGSIHFYVKAVDDDNDSLRYIWMVNKEPRGINPNFHFEGQLYPLGDVLVEALVFDPYDTVSTQWTFKLITLVELSLFQGTFEPYKGIVLDWETRYEYNNAGFYVLRSGSKDGVFEQISDFIPSEKRGVYRFVDNAADLTRNFYKLRTIQTDGKITDFEPIRVAAEVPSDYTLEKNYPNPFNPVTNIRFSVPRKSHIKVSIYNILGRQVRILIDSPLKPGFYVCQWNGKNENGRLVGAGVYYYIMTGNGFREVRKMVLVK